MIYKSLIPTFGLLVITVCLPKVGIKLLLPESLVFTCARILFLVSLLIVAHLDPFDPYLPFKI